MPVGGRVFVRGVSESEAKFTRAMFFIGWVAVITGVAWAIYSDSPTMSVGWPIGWTVVALLVGRFVGYRCSIFPSMILIRPHQQTVQRPE